MGIKFLRRFKKKHLVNGNLAPAAFECDVDEAGLSFHIREGLLANEEGVTAYQASFPFGMSGDLLGVCEVPDAAFAGMNSPKRRPPAESQPFAAQHCELRPCPDLGQAAQLAKFAVTLLDYKSAKKAKR